ncbi:MAG TPA: TlpA family protein disulfide reductase [Desulfobacteraceae bacterium]|jgi:peroxiredoxin|nr:TlpA family protein disulfide reductase [Desulfobacteraceae bacterium]
MSLQSKLAGFSSPVKWVAVVLFLAMVFFAVLSVGRNHDDVPAPLFILKDIYGETVTLDEYKGNVVLLDFWATWCPPCRESIPELVSLQNEYESLGLVVLGVSLDEDPKTGDRELKSFIREKGINYRVIRYTRELLADYFGDDQIAIPTMFVIDRNGAIRDKLVGFRPGALEKSLESVM